MNLASLLQWLNSQFGPNTQQSKDSLFQIHREKNTDQHWTSKIFVWEKGMEILCSPTKTSHCLQLNLLLSPQFSQTLLCSFTFFLKVTPNFLYWPFKKKTSKKQNNSPLPSFLLFGHLQKKQSTNTVWLFWEFSLNHIVLLIINRLSLLSWLGPGHFRLSM